MSSWDQSTISIKTETLDDCEGAFGRHKDLKSLAWSTVVWRSKGHGQILSSWCSLQDLFKTWVSEKEGWSDNSYILWLALGQRGSSLCSLPWGRRIDFGFCGSLQRRKKGCEEMTGNSQTGLKIFLRLLSHPQLEALNILSTTHYNSELQREVWSSIPLKVLTFIP